MPDRLLVTFSSDTLLVVVAMHWARIEDAENSLLSNPTEIQFLLVACNLLVKVVHEGAEAGSSETST